MKNTKIITAILSCMTFLSCSDFLEVEDLDQLTSTTVFVSETDLSYALNQLYTYLPIPNIDNNGNNTLGIVPYFWTDDAIHRGINNGAGRQASDYNWTTTNNVLDAFYRYDALADINYFLEALPNSSFVNEDNRERFGAEARFFRAFLYEGMVLAYGDVPLVTEVIDADVYLSRTSRLEVFNFVIQELDEIANILPETYSAQDAGRITKGAALALKARAYLNALGWHSDQSVLYAGAADACKEIIDSGVYSLAPGIEGFSEQFTSASDLVSPETILANIYVPGTRTHELARNLAPKGSWRGSAASYGNNQSRPGYTADFIEEVQTINGLFPKDDLSYNPASPWENRDPRLAVSAILPGDELPAKSSASDIYVYQPHPNISPNTDNITGTSNPTGYSFRKYIDFNLDAMDQGDADYKIIRYSEVLLMYAEALAGKGDNAGALTYLDKVRERVGMPKYADIGLPNVTRGTTGNQMIDAILLERRYEFAGEGPQRWFDIWRYKLGDQVIGQVYGIPESTILPGDLVGSKYKADGDSYSRVWNDKFYLLPIHQNILDANPNIEQNPGW